jgi:hypothetical protein
LFMFRSSFFVHAFMFLSSCSFFCSYSDPVFCSCPPPAFLFLSSSSFFAPTSAFQRSSTIITRCISAGNVWQTRMMSFVLPRQKRKPSECEMPNYN